jgi:secreted trypsin-like serine protease
MATLVGVNSYGRGCGYFGLPGVYSTIADNWQWIQSTISKNSKILKNDTNQVSFFVQKNAKIVQINQDSTPKKMPFFKDLVIKKAVLKWNTTVLI